MRRKPERQHRHAPAATFTRSPVSSNTAQLNGGGIYNGIRGTLTTTGVSGSPMDITGNTATTLRGGGIAASPRYPTASTNYRTRQQLPPRLPAVDDVDPPRWTAGTVRVMTTHLATHDGTTKTVTQYHR